MLAKKLVRADETLIWIRLGIKNLSTTVSLSGEKPALSYYSCKYEELKIP